MAQNEYGVKCIVSDRLGDLGAIAGESGERIANTLCCDEADEEFVVPGGDFAPQSD
jgi:hypothetical protein